MTLDSGENSRTDDDTLTLILSLTNDVAERLIDTLCELYIKRCDVLRWLGNELKLINT